MTSSMSPTQIENIWNSANIGGSYGAEDIIKCGGGRRRNLQEYCPSDYIAISEGLGGEGKFQVDVSLGYSFEKMSECTKLCDNWRDCTGFEFKAGSPGTCITYTGG